MDRSEPEVPLRCEEVREQLSDLLDVRRGESPAEEVSPLGLPGRRSALEAHLFSCPACRLELDSLQELGLAYSDYSVGEKAVQEFAAYPAQVRMRVKSEMWVPGRAVMSIAEVKRSGSPWKSWLGVGAASAAAAVLAVVLAPLLAKHLSVRTAKHRVDAAPRAEDAAKVAGWGQGHGYLRPYRPLPVVPGPIDVDFSPAGQGSVHRSFRVDPSAQDSVKRLEQEMRQTEAAVLAENRDKQRALLGLSLVVKASETPTADTPEGLAVWDVLPGSPAARAGLRPGDYIMGLNDLSFGSSSATEVLKLIKGVEDLGQGEVLSIDYARLDDKDWVIRKGVVVLGEYDK